MKRKYVLQQVFPDEVTQEVNRFGTISDAEAYVQKCGLIGADYQILFLVRILRRTRNGNKEADES